jgi:hypothetical protein
VWRRPGHPVHRVAAGGLWEVVFSRDNLAKALQRVERNKGAPGVDGITTEQLRPWLHEHWPAIREALDAGRYKPSPVRRVEIPKPDGGVRLLGVPTVLDRLIQQAIAQVLSPIFDAQSRRRVSGSVRGVALIRPWKRLGATSLTATGGWSMSTKSRAIGSAPPWSATLQRTRCRAV